MERSRPVSAPSTATTCATVALWGPWFIGDPNRHSADLKLYPRLSPIHVRSMKASTSIHLLFTYMIFCCFALLTWTILIFVPVPRTSVMRNSQLKKDRTAAQLRLLGWKDGICHSSSVSKLLPLWRGTGTESDTNLPEENYSASDESDRCLDQSYWKSGLTHRTFSVPGFRWKPWSQMSDEISWNFWGIFFWPFDRSCSWILGIEASVVRNPTAFLRSFMACFRFVGYIYIYCTYITRRKQNSPEHSKSPCRSQEWTIQAKCSSGLNEHFFSLQPCARAACISIQ